MNVEEFRLSAWLQRMKDFPQIPIAITEELIKDVTLVRNYIEFQKPRMEELEGQLTLAHKQLQHEVQKNVSQIKAVEAAEKERDAWRKEALTCEREKEEALFALTGVKSGVLGWCSEHKRIKDIKRLEMFLKDDVPLSEEGEEEDDE